MNICTLVLTHDTPLWNSFDRVKRQYLESKNEHYYFLYNGTDTTKDNKSEKNLNHYSPDIGDPFNVDGGPMMLAKLMHAVQSDVLNEYDFIIRVNSSTFINIDKIKEELKTKTDNVYMGFYEPTWDFVSGACIIFSKDVLYKLYDFIQINGMPDCSIGDDVVIGRILKTLNVPMTYLDRYDYSTLTELPDIENLRNALTYPQIRIKNGMRTEPNRVKIDTGIWNMIAEQLNLTKDNTTLIQQRFNDNKQKPSDINEHLETLYRYAKLCKHITEFGTRHGESTSALLAAEPDKLISYDLYKDIDIINFYTSYKNFIFHQDDTLKVNIEKTDLLFIDTLHTYFQLLNELNTHSKNVSKYIILHDTVSYGYNDEAFYGVGADVKMSNLVTTGIKSGLNNAINDFLQTEEGSNWIVKEVFTNNNGLTILARKNIDIL